MQITFFPLRILLLEKFGEQLELISEMREPWEASTRTHKFQLASVNDVK